MEPRGQRRNPIPANRIKQLRERMLLTQGELAKLTDQDATTVNKHENGARGMSAVLIRAYARVLKVETHELFVDAESFQDAEADED